MTGFFGLDWAALALSFFNTLVLIWLGFTVLLNAENRTFGVWLAGGGLLVGGLFFISHTAILGEPIFLNSPSLDFWWHAGWFPIILAPSAWYVVVLYYTGFWDEKETPIRRRQQPWFLLVVALSLGQIILLAFGNPLPTFSQVALLDFSAVLTVGGIPVLLLIYPLHILFSISLSIDALLRPGPTDRLMGSQARQRARPWMLFASCFLLLVCLLVGVVMFWVIQGSRQPHSIYELYRMFAIPLAWLDLVIEGLIALAVLTIGQAIVSYEIFTGKPLPRQGLRRSWFNALVLSAGAGCLASYSLLKGFQAIYILLLALLMAIVFYALLTWRSFSERELTMRRLRPFLSSQRLFDQLAGEAAAVPVEVNTPSVFKALVEEVIGARQACLVPLGAAAPLAGPALLYPPELVEPADLSEVVEKSQTPHTIVLALQPELYNGLNWAVPLWSERGLVGMLLLGEKTDGGFYTQEEIEIARVSGERLLDLAATAELASRLMALQRQRMASAQLLDQQTRRALHDDILPSLHTTLLNLSSLPAPTPPAVTDSIQRLSSTHRQIADLLHQIPVNPNLQLSRLGLIGTLRQVLKSELDKSFDRVDWSIEPQAEQISGQLSPTLLEVLYYAGREALRNAACHARQGKDIPLHVQIRLSSPSGGLLLEIEDDGIGLETGRRSPHGGGKGLALHSTLMAAAGGTLSVESKAGVFTRISLFLPASSLGQGD
jgi:signal transduction histidine kinase